MKIRLRNLVDLINLFETIGVGFSSVEDKIDTSTPIGHFTFHIFDPVAQFERDIIRMRTLAGSKAARVRGRIVGRPRRLYKNLKTKLCLLRLCIKKVSSP